jgi:hypothetical protein
MQRKKSRVQGIEFWRESIIFVQVQRHYPNRS